MASVNEQIVREYFETLGFFVTQPNKHQVAARHKYDAEEIDLLISRPGAAGVVKFPPAVLWGAKELDKVQRAIVSIRGWHTEKFTPSSLRSNPELFRFAEYSVTKEARKKLGAGSVAKILCISGLTPRADLQRECFRIFKENGIDGVVLFPAMLLELLKHIDPALNYEKSGLLQILRILKSYDLIKKPQLELFGSQK